MNYEDCTLVELRQYAKEKGIKGYSKLKREELINSLNNENISSKEKSESSKIELASINSDNKVLSDNKSENDNTTIELYDTPKVVDGYNLSSPNDFIGEGILEVLPDGYGF